MKSRMIMSGVLVLLICFLSACMFGSGPEKTVSNFCKAMKEFDIEGMKEYTDEDANDFNDAMDSENDNVSYLMDYFKENAKKLSYVVNDAQINDKTAVVPVEFTYQNASEVFRATLKKVLSETMASAFSGEEMSDAEMEALFISAFNEGKENNQPASSKTTINFSCEKTENGWIITDVKDEVYNVMTCGFQGVGKEISDAFNGSSDETTTEETTAKEIRFDKGIGDLVTLATIKIKFTGYKETDTLRPEYGDPVRAKDGCKFVIVNAEIENITKSTLDFDASSIPIYDDKDREYQFYDDAIWGLDDVLLYESLAPNIVEKGVFVYEVPTDALSYVIVLGKTGTDEFYYFSIK